MSRSTRRGFLAMAGVGAAAAAGAAAIGTRAGQSLSAPAPQESAVPEGSVGSLMAYVHDVGSGEVTVLVDGHETVIHDPGLVATLAAHAATAHSDASARV